VETVAAIETSSLLCWAQLQVIGWLSITHSIVCRASAPLKTIDLELQLSTNLPK
jgi:hypothetical protein